MPEGVGAAVEKREVSASFHELRGSVKKKKKKKKREAAGQQLPTGRGLWGWLDTALPAASHKI